VNVQFDWWLLIVGFVLGAGMTGLVLAELRRREDDVTARERAAEAALRRIGALKDPEPEARPAKQRRRGSSIN